MPQLKAVLHGHGYIGASTASAPRADLGSTPEQLGRHRGSATSSAAFAEGIVDPSNPLEEDSSRWTAQLPPDLVRGAPEIYRNIRSEGHAGVRSWLSEEYKGQQNGQEWISPWNDASNIDFTLRKATSTHEVMQALATEDSLEIAFRRLSAYVYMQRTGDEIGGMKMLAIVPPGTSTDIAPAWMVNDSSLYSKHER